MADCTRCGTRAGIGKSVCKDCEPIIKAEEQELRLAQVKREREIREKRAEQQREKQEKEQIARQERWESFLAVEFARLQELLDTGITPYIYDQILIDSQSYFTDQENVGFWSPRVSETTHTVGQDSNLTDLETRGLQGWEVIATIPVTFGAVLTNTVGSNLAYAGGYGGMVVGARLILRLPITATAVLSRSAVIEEALARRFPG